MIRYFWIIFLNKHKLIHDYLDVDLDVVWKTIESDLPLLKGLVSKI